MAKVPTVPSSSKPKIIVAMHQSLQSAGQSDLPQAIDGRPIEYNYVSGSHPGAMIHVLNSQATATCLYGSGQIPSNVCVIVGNIRKCGTDQNNLHRTGSGMYYALPTFHQGFREHLTAVIRTVCKTGVPVEVVSNQARQPRRELAWA